MSDLLSGERQVAPVLEGIRFDHRARYEWAASRLRGKRVVDAGCGVGYGSKILAEAGCTVHAYDRSEDAIKFARVHYNHDDRIRYEVADLVTLGADGFDAVVCFEALEHLSHPEKALRLFRGMAPVLYFSVPDQDGFKFDADIRFHQRHYTRAQIEGLLEGSGWRVTEVLRQKDPHSGLEDIPVGRTIVGVAERIEDFIDAPDPTDDEILRSHLINGVAPKSVAIIAMGPSSRSYLLAALKAGSKKNLVDEVWGTNNMTGLIHTDRTFMMDDLKIQEARAEKHSGIAAMLQSLREYEGRAYTSRAYPDWPNIEQYPLEWVLNRNRRVGYFNNTPPYALAFAAALGVEDIHIYGCDYAYQGANNAYKRERGRACLENWMGWAQGRGIRVTLPTDTTLMDTSDPVLYGYDSEYVKVVFEDGKFAVSRSPREPSEIPTAEEMEFRYSHDPRLEALEGKVKL